MSLRYTNGLTAVLRHRILMERGREEIATRTFEGRCAGVALTYTASGAIRNIRVEDALQYRYASPDGAVQNVEALSAAIKGAIADGNRQLRAAKEEAYRRSFSGNTAVLAEGARDNAIWAEQEGPTLRPWPFDALKDAPAVAHAVRRESTTSSLAKLADKKTGLLPPPTETGLVEAAKHVTGIAAVHRTYLPTLLFLDREYTTALAAGSPTTAAVAGAGGGAWGATSGVVDFTQNARRYVLADQEKYFWQRVSLIRRAQVNVSGTTVKRGYAKLHRTPTADQQTGTAQSFTEKIQVRFAY